MRESRIVYFYTRDKFARVCAREDDKRKKRKRECLKRNVSSRIFRAKILQARFPTRCFISCDALCVCNIFCYYRDLLFWFFLFARNAGVGRYGVGGGKEDDENYVVTPGLFLSAVQRTKLRVYARTYICAYIYTHMYIHIYI